MVFGPGISANARLLGILYLDYEMGCQTDDCGRPTERCASGILV